MKNIINIKTPSNIYLWWNIGSSIIIIISIQIITGIILSINYINKNNIFDRSVNIYININYGWIIRLIHRNTTSILFILIFIHITRGIIFKSFVIIKIWITGILILIITILESFIGYSLIWNQISYWAIIVITNFISAIPNLGNKIIKVIWGNFNINIILINRFLSIHFIIPIIIITISLIHLLILHNNKSNNPIGLINKTDIIKLNPIFIIKDIILLTIIIIILININLNKPFIFSNRDNFIIINYFKTPSHIEPEWYFLFFYSILRSINNKIRGLTILIISIVIIILIPKFNKNKFQSFNPTSKSTIIILIIIILIISIIRTKPVEYPFKEINFLLIKTFFIIFFFIKIINKAWNKIT